MTVSNMSKRITSASLRHGSTLCIAALLLCHSGCWSLILVSTGRESLQMLGLIMSDLLRFTARRAASLLNSM